MAFWRIVFAEIDVFLDRLAPDPGVTRWLVQAVFRQLDRWTLTHDGGPHNSGYARFCYLTTKPGDGYAARPNVGRSKNVCFLGLFNGVGDTGLEPVTPCL